MVYFYTLSKLNILYLFDQIKIVYYFFNFSDGNIFTVSKLCVSPMFIFPTFGLNN